MQKYITIPDYHRYEPNRISFPKRENISYLILPAQLNLTTHQSNSTCLKILKSIKRTKDEDSLNYDIHILIER